MRNPEWPAAGASLVLSIPILMHKHRESSQVCLKTCEAKPTNGTVVDGGLMRVETREESVSMARGIGRLGASEARRALA